MFWLYVPFVVAVAVAITAHGAGRNSIQWLVYALILPPVALIHLLSLVHRQLKQIWGDKEGLLFTFKQTFSSKANILLIAIPFCSASSIVSWNLYAEYRSELLSKKMVGAWSMFYDKDDAGIDCSGRVYYFGQNNKGYMVSPYGIRPTVLKEFYWGIDTVIENWRPVSYLLVPETPRLSEAHVPPPIFGPVVGIGDAAIVVRTISERARGAEETVVSRRCNRALEVLMQRTLGE